MQAARKRRGQKEHRKTVHQSRDRKSSKHVWHREEKRVAQVANDLFQHQFPCPLTTLLPRSVRHMRAVRAVDSTGKRSLVDPCVSSSFLLPLLLDTVFTMQVCNQPLCLQLPHTAPPRKQKTRRDIAALAIGLMPSRDIAGYLFSVRRFVVCNHDDRPCVVCMSGPLGTIAFCIRH